MEKLNKRKNANVYLYLSKSLLFGMGHVPECHGLSAFAVDVHAPP